MRSSRATIRTGTRLTWASSAPISTGTLSAAVELTPDGDAAVEVTFAVDGDDAGQGAWLSDRLTDEILLMVYNAIVTADGVDVFTAHDVAIHPVIARVISVEGLADASPEAAWALYDRIVDALGDDAVF